MIRNEYTPGLTTAKTPTALDGCLLTMTIQGFGALSKTTLSNTYQYVNLPRNIPACTILLEKVYAIISKANRGGHNVIWTGDLNAVLNPAQQLNYAPGGGLVVGDALLQKMVTKMGATNTPGQDKHAWQSKTGEQRAVLDHILVSPPDLRVESGGTFFTKDPRFDHAVRWITVNGNDIGFHMVPNPTRTPFKPQIQR